MSEKPVSFADLEQAMGVEEEMGYDVPFISFTWERWQVMQGHLLQSFTRFQRAIEQKNTRLACTITLEMQEIVLEMQKEACLWIGVNQKH